MKADNLQRCTQYFCPHLCLQCLHCLALCSKLIIQCSLQSSGKNNDARPSLPLIQLHLFAKTFYVERQCSVWNVPLFNIIPDTNSQC